MTNEINISFTDSTLSDLLKTGKYRTVLLQFYHGLGDAIDFRANVLPVLCKEFPDVHFALALHCGQQDLFGEVDTDEAHYDLAVRVKFPCAEWDDGDETKAEKCLRVEMGIVTKQPELYPRCEWRGNGSPLISTHFFSTSNDGLCAPEPLARLIWDEAVHHDMIPFDTHFVHDAAVNKIQPYPWQTRNVADIAPTPRKLADLLSVTTGFAGVASGNFWMALCILPPQKILYIETEFPAAKLTRLPVHSVKSPGDAAEIHAWLRDCKARG